MRVDTGFWRKDGTYIENIEDLDINSTILCIAKKSKKKSYGSC